MLKLKSVKPKWTWQMLTEHFTQTQYYMSFSAPHGFFSKTDHILGYQASLNIYNTIEMTSSILSEHHRVKLDRPSPVGV